MKIVMRYFVAVVMFLLPIVFLPMAVDAYGFGKNWVILVLGLVGILLWIGELLVSRSENLKFNLAMIVGWVVAVWAGYLWTRESPGVQMASVMNVGGIGTILSLAIWWFLWVQRSSVEDRKLQLNFLTAAGILVAVTSLIVFVIPSTNLPISIPNKENPLVTISSGWSLTGSLLSEVILFLFLVMEWIKRLTKRLKANEGYIKEAVIAAVLSLTMLLSIYKLFKAGWVALDGNSAWVIATETFKVSPIFGAGPGNFIQAFNLFRPKSYNTTPYWTNAFGVSSSGILQVWTELGIVGLIGILLLVWMVVVRKKDFDWVRLAIMGAVVLFTPINLVGLMLMVWLAANKLGEIRKAGLVVKMGNTGFNGAPWVVSIALTAGVIFSGYWLFRIMIGDVYMRQALVAAAKNDGGTTYNLQIKAIGMNPTNADYRRMYSQTNLALATSLLSTENPSEDDKQKASVLIQQAVREGKAAVTLDQMNSLYWSNLATIYRGIIGAVDGSADYAYQAYTQAVALDPVNPLLRLDLGGLLFAAQRYDEADRAFEEVVVNKQDFANGWYNWANTAKQMNRIDLAVQRLTQAVALVPKDSGDYETANKELTAWTKEYDEAVKKQQELLAQQQAQQQQKKPETLKTAEPLPTINPEEKVNVPAEQLEPPQPVVTPTPEETATPSPSVTP